MCSIMYKYDLNMRNLLGIISERRFMSTKPLIIRQKFVPKCEQPTTEMVSSLQDFLGRHRRTMIITGAGLSTESGIPDYRSENVGLYSRKNYKPMNYQDFIKSAYSRQRYWARSYIGWPGYSRIRPAESHRLLSQWEKSGIIHWLITQNVDHLHILAGSKKVTELHGTLYRVACLQCKNVIPRNLYQTHIERLNPNWSVRNFEIATDGDVFLTDQQIEGFKVPQCSECGGDMMPQIVFFGDNVPKNTVQHLFDRVRLSDSILVLGSSLQVYSAYRFVHFASEQNKPISIVNIGETRGDKLATLKINAKIGDILPLVQLAGVS